MKHTPIVKLNVELTDVLEEADGTRQPPIPIILEYASRGQFGISIYPIHVAYDESRIVVENHAGKMTVHIWATEESVGNDPTHSIEIERG